MIYDNVFRWSPNGNFLMVADEVDFVTRVLPTEFGVATNEKVFHAELLNWQFEYKFDHVHGVKGYRHRVW